METHHVEGSPTWKQSAKNRHVGSCETNPRTHLPHSLFKDSCEIRVRHDAMGKLLLFLARRGRVRFYSPTSGWGGGCKIKRLTFF